MRRTLLILALLALPLLQPKVAAAADALDCGLPPACISASDFVCLGRLSSYGLCLANNTFLGDAVGRVSESFQFNATVGRAILNWVMFEVTGTNGDPNITGQVTDGALYQLAASSVALAANPPNIKTGDFFVNKVLADNLLVAPKVQAATVPFPDYLKGTDELKQQFMVPGSCFIGVCVPLPTIRGRPANTRDFFWKGSRNLAYTFFIIVIVATGLMVMFRYRLDPRTVVSAIDFLPKAAVSLVLITFSWPLVGLLLDISHVLVNLVNTLWSVPGSDRGWNLVTGVILAPLLNINLQIVPGGGGGINDVSNFLTRVIMAIMAMVVCLMLLFELVKRWVMILVLAVFGPLAIAWGTLPGQEDTTGTWFKNLLVGALSFPGIYAIILIAVLFANIGTNTTGTSLGYIIPGSNIGGLIAIVLILTATKLPAIIEDLLEIKAPAGRAGLQTGKVLGGMPFVGGLFK